MFFYFPPLERRYRCLKESSFVGIKGYRKDKSGRGVGTILAKSRATSDSSYLFTRSDPLRVTLLSLDSGLRELSVPLRRLRKSAADRCSVSKRKEKKVVRKSKMTYKPRCHRDVTIDTRRVSFFISSLQKRMLYS